MIYKERVLIKAPTGFGKGVLIYKILNVIPDCRRILIFTPRRLLNK
jgi:superfamily II DNA or RNA helicase